MITPGATIGILGGGQLGRMSAMAARRLGYRVVVWEPEPQCPAAGVVDRVLAAPYSDTAALHEFAAAVQVVTVEFENIPAEILRSLEERVPVRPSAIVLEICQNREREKNFLARAGFPVARYEVIDSASTLAAALARMKTPAILKTASFGYDGKGQQALEAGVDVERAWSSLGVSRAVLEESVSFQAELSVICARGPDDRVAVFPVVKNVHRRHILDVSFAPGGFSPEVAAEAESLAVAITRELKVIGLLAVEMFLTADGRLLVNELAPRPHNSGHFSLDACVTSQFEQHVRAVCGLPLGSTHLLSRAAMINLLGDLWADGPPDWQTLLAHPFAKLHLYGKDQARSGRKMGHVCLLESNIQGVGFDLEQELVEVRKKLGLPPLG